MSEACNHGDMIKRKETELISPELLEHLFGKPVSVPPVDRNPRSKTELISQEFLDHLFAPQG